MKTITIDIPDNHTDEVMIQLNKLGVTVRESSLERLDSLTKDDYHQHFANQAGSNKKKLIKHL